MMSNFRSQLKNVWEGTECRVLKYKLAKLLEKPPFWKRQTEWLPMGTSEEQGDGLLSYTAHSFVMNL